MADTAAMLVAPLKRNPTGSKLGLLHSHSVSRGVAGGKTASEEENTRLPDSLRDSMLPSTREQRGDTDYDTQR